MKTASYLLIIFASIYSSACSENNGSSELPEVFDSLTRPYFEYNEAEDFYLLKLWNYELGLNNNRSYPLVIFLHGSGGAGNISYLSHIGYDNPMITKTMKRHLRFNKNILALL